MPNDFFQPQGDPYRYKVKGDTVQFVATQDTAGHRKGETGEVSKSQIINDNPEWARRHLNVDPSPKAASEPGGTSRPRPDSPEPETTQRQATPADSTQAASGGESVLDMIRKASGAAAPNAVQRNAQAKQKEGDSQGGGGFIDRNLRGLGIGTRGILEGVGSTIGIVGDVVNSAIEGEPRPGSTRQAMSSLLDAAGLPEAQISTEQAAKVANQIGGGMIAPGGAVGSAGRGGQAAGQALSRGSRPVKDLIRMAMGGGPSSADDGLTPAQRLAQQRARPTDESADLERWLRKRTRPQTQDAAQVATKQTSTETAASNLSRQSRAPSPAQGETVGQAVPARSEAAQTAASGTRGGTINTPRAAQAHSAFGGFSDATDQSVPKSVIELINRARTGAPPARMPAEDEVLELLNRIRNVPPSRRGAPMSSGRVQP